MPYGFEFALRTTDGLPFEPPTVVCAVPNMAVGDILTFSATRQARVVAKQDDGIDQELLERGTYGVLVVVPVE
jgi:hypothetical protein